MSPARMAALWEAHTAHELETRDPEATLETMVEDAYVNHIPTMPPDTELEPISRTIGEDQLVDEMIFKFTHTVEMPWMLPGVAPTGRRVEIPLVAIVRFRDGKLAHEHIYWDQASVLKQLGLIKVEGLPVFGVETAERVRRGASADADPSDVILGSDHRL